MLTRRVKVPVATIWTSKEAPEKSDVLSLQGDNQQWIAQMSDEQSIELSDKGKIGTQVLFNDEVIIKEEVGDWAQVYVVNQKDDKTPLGYLGWIKKDLLTDTEVKYPLVTSTVRIADEKATLYDADKQPVMELSLGTVLVEINKDAEWIEVYSPLGKGYIKADAIVINHEGINAGQTMVNNAKQFLGMRYLWGGISADGYDCSGLMYSMHRLLGFEIPRDADDQRMGGQEIAPEELLPGDLVFFANDHGTGYVHHVGMYIGNGQMIESRTPGKQVDIADLTEPKFAAEFAGFRRYWR